jgi:hypothetical protein
MRRYPLFIALALAGTASGLLYLLVPGALWTNSSLFSAAILVVALMTTILLPFMSSVSINLGIVGPALIFSFFFIITSALVLAAALTSYTTHLDALNLGNVFIALVGFLILSASSEIVAVNEDASTKKSFHSFMSHQLSQLAEIHSSSAALNQRITKLVNDLRFAPIEPISESSSEQKAAFAKLAQLKDILMRSDVESYNQAFLELEQSIRVVNSSSKFSKSKA